MNPKPNQENPSRNIESKTQSQETIEVKELTPDEIALQEEKRAHEQKKVAELSKEIVQKAGVENTEIKGEEGTSFTVPPQTKKRGFFGKLLLGLSLFTAGTAGAQSTKSAEKDVIKNTQAKEVKVSEEERLAPASVPYKMGLTFYKGGKTHEGSITPTGKLNSFDNNEYGITEKDAYEIAENHGFRTTNNKDFQTDLLNYVKQNHPELIKEVLKKFGQTNAGTLYDGIIGARTMYLLKFFKEKGMQGEGEVEIVYKRPEPKKDSIPNIDTIPEKKIPPSLENFDELYIYFDLSPSMKANQKSLAEELRKIGREKPVTIIGFTDKADTTFSAQSTREAADILESIKLIDKNTELAIDVLLQTLPEKSFSFKKNNVIAVVTDEALQGVTKEKLVSMKKLAQEQNLTFQFRMMVRGKQIIYSIDEIIDIYNENYGDKVESRINELQKGIEIRNKQLKEFEEQIKTAEGKAKKQLQTMIKQTQNELVIFYQKLKTVKEVNITGYENENKK
jgi:hypothetical protein